MFKSPTSFVFHREAVFALFAGYVASMSADHLGGPADFAGSSADSVQPSADCEIADSALKCRRLTLTGIFHLETKDLKFHPLT